MTEPGRCPQCGTNLPADAPQGLCPACLLRQAAAAQPPAANEPAPTTAASAFTPLSPEELGEHFPEFDILEFVGQGGMGAVYKARQRSLDRLVALKILPPEVDSDPAFAERFSREANAMAKLSHPSIVVVYDFDERDGLHYLLMEYVDGVNLRDAIKAGSLTADKALAVIPQICDALQYAHDQGVVHRDIKPENVLLDKQGRVKIADFGLAKLLGRSPAEVTLTATHQVMGTMHYMAPEQLERPLEVDHRADIYSLGVVFYELLTGELPLGRFKLPSEKARLDNRLDDVVLKTLEREPDERYQHASDVKIDVEQIQDQPAVAPAADRIPEASSPAKLLSAPAALTLDGEAMGSGVARFDGRQLTIEFELSEDDAGWFAGSDVSSGLGCKPGRREAHLALAEIASVNFKEGWFSDEIRIQAHVMKAVADIPGSNRAGVTLSVEKDDAAAARRLVEAVSQDIGSMPLDATAASLATSVEESEPDKPQHLVFHPGLVLLGLVMLAVGLVGLYAGFNTWHQEFIWIGMGVALGGGGTMAGAFKFNVSTDQQLYGPHPGRLLFGALMTLLGGLLYVTTMFDMGPLIVFVWIGLGLAIGGGGTMCSAWEAHTEPTGFRLADGAAGQLLLGVVMIGVGIFLFAMGNGGVGSRAVFAWIGLGVMLGGGGTLCSAWTAKPREQPDDWALAEVARVVRGPATGLIIVGVLNLLLPVLLLLAAFTFVGVRGPAPVGLIVPLQVEGPVFNYAWGTMIPMLGVPIASIPIAFALLVGGTRMKRFELYGLAVTASVLAMLPCHVGFLIGLPIGLWSLIVLNRDEVKAAFAGGSSPNDGTVPPQKPIKAATLSAPTSVASTTVPGVGLIVIGVLDCLATAALVATMFWQVSGTTESGAARASFLQLALIGGIPIFSLVMLAGGIALARGRWYGLALCGAIAAVIPCRVMWLLSLPFGVWALILLSDVRVRRDFAARAEQVRFDRDY